MDKALHNALAAMAIIAIAVFAVVTGTAACRHTEAETKAPWYTTQNVSPDPADERTMRYEHGAVTLRVELTESGNTVWRITNHHQTKSIEAIRIEAKRNNPKQEVVGVVSRTAENISPSEVRLIEVIEIGDTVTFPETVQIIWGS